ncbi:acyltransferase [Actinomyces bovis]|nr:acyltransferase [Actinomyces bovis]
MALRETVRTTTRTRDNTILIRRPTAPQPQRQPRRHELDVLRIFAVVMVVMANTNAGLFKGAATHDHAFVVADVWAALQCAGIPLFFMISGATLLRGPDLDRRRLLWQTIGRLLFLYLFWSAFYAAYKVHAQGDYSKYNIALQLAKGYEHLWLLLAMIMAYLLVPPIHAALHRGHLEVRWLVAAFVVVVLIWHALNLVPLQSALWHELVAKFAPAQAQYVGYMLLGYWLDHWRFGSSTRFLAPIVFLAASAASAYGTYWYCLHQSSYKVEWLFGPFSPTTVLQAVSLFCLALSWRSWKPDAIASRAVREVSGAALGVYLLHPYILEVLKNRGIQAQQLGVIFGVPRLALIVAFGCLVVTFTARHLPLVRRTV